MSDGRTQKTPHHHHPAMLDILDKPPDARSAREVDKILSLALEIPFFARGLRYSLFSLAVLKSICRNLLVEDFDDNDIVFRAGDVGTKFYVVFSGEVHVLVEHHERDAAHLSAAQQAGGEVVNLLHGEADSAAAAGTSAVVYLPADGDCQSRAQSRAESRAQSRAQTLRESAESPEAGEAKAEAVLSQLQTDRAADERRSSLFLLRKAEHIDVEEEVVGCIGMVKVAVIQAGGSFGDLALMNHEPRSAYVVTKSETVLLTLSRDVYEGCISQYEKKLIAERSKTIHRMPVFHSWPESDLEALCMLLGERHVRAGEVVVRQGDAGSDLFLVKSGELRGIKKVRASDLGLGLVGCDGMPSDSPAQTDDRTRTRRTRSASAPGGNGVVHPGGWVFLNLCTYEALDFFGEGALLPRSTGGRKHGAGRVLGADEDDEDAASFVYSKQAHAVHDREARSHDDHTTFHNKASWEKHAKKHRQPHSVVAVVPSHLYVVSKQVFGRRVQQFAESLRPHIEGQPTDHEALVSHSETVDWQLFKSAVMHDTLARAHARRVGQEERHGLGSGAMSSGARAGTGGQVVSSGAGASASVSASASPAGQASPYKPSTGHSLPLTRFTSVPHDPMLNYLEARKELRARRPAGRTPATSSDAQGQAQGQAHLLVSPLRRRRVAEMRRARRQEKAKQAAAAAGKRSADPLTSQRRGSYFGTFNASTRSGGAGFPATRGVSTKHLRKPPSARGTGARKQSNHERHVGSSRFWDLDAGWTSRPPLTLEHRRLLQPGERKQMREPRSRRFKTILSHQVHATLARMHKKDAERVLEHAASPGDNKRSSLRLGSVSQMLGILGHSKNDGAVR